MKKIIKIFNGIFIILALSVSNFALGAGILPGDIFISVATPGAGAVYRITGGGDFSTATPYATGLSDPYGLAFSPSGRLMVVERISGEVTDITAGGDYSGVSAYASGLKNPRGMMIDSGGRMLVTELGTGNVIDVTGGGLLTSANIFASGLSGPRDMLQLADGRILVGEETSGEVTDITSGGDYSGVTPFAGGLYHPYGIAQGPNGHIYVSEIFNGTILDITNGGNAFPVFASGMSYVDEIAFDSEGNLLAVQEFANSVVDASAGGDLSGAVPFATGLGQYPQQIAVAPAPVPLPAAFWLLFSGLISFFSFRKHQK